MAKQLVQPNLDPYIYDGNVAINDWLGWCLGYVNAAFNVTPHAYTAWRAWTGTTQKRHEDRNFPTDVYFPIWFSHYGSYNGTYDNWGHVAICYVRGDTGAMQIWSSPITHKPFADTWNSIGEVERYYSSTFVGWSEDLGGVQLIDTSPDIAPNQRITAAICFARELPSTSAAVFQKIDANEVISMRGYVTNGEEVEGNKTWFVTARSSKFISAQVLTDTSTHDLPDLTSELFPATSPPSNGTPATPTVPPAPSPKDDTSYILVVNKKHPLVADFVPSDLVSVGNGQQLRKDAADMLKAMQDDSGADVLISPQSGYRSFAKQQEVYNSYDPATRDTFSARAGFSEHQTGLAIDFGPIDVSFEKTKAFTWLTENAHKYGFILRFPKGKEAITGYQYEPWHWRYVGSVASDIHAHGQTLEEYFNVEGGDYAQVSTPRPVENPVTSPTVDSPLDVENNKLLKSIIGRLTNIAGWIKKIMSTLGVK